MRDELETILDCRQQVRMSLRKVKASNQVERCAMRTENLYLEHGLVKSQCGQQLMIERNVVGKAVRFKM